MARIVPRLAGCALALAIAAPAFATATPTAEYVFGDSLSDNGNLAEIEGANFPNPPSYHDSFTNGPVAAAVLDQALGLPALTPSLWATGFADPHNLFGGASFVPGTNYAVAGATAAAQAVGGATGINLPQQVGAYGAMSGGSANPNALYVLFIGGNDVALAVEQQTGAAAVNAGVTAEVAAVETLLGEGARDFLVVNVPNIGATPDFLAAGAPASAAATALSQLYDSELSSALAALTVPAGADITQFNLYALDQSILANPAAYGFTDTIDPCYLNAPGSAVTSTACGANAQNISSFAYWNGFHPTAPVQAIWGRAFASALGISAVPEPSSWLLLILGFGLVGVMLRGEAARALTVAAERRG